MENLIKNIPKSPFRNLPGSFSEEASGFWELVDVNQNV